MLKFHSKDDNNAILHVIADANQLYTTRQDVSPPDQLLQASIIPLAQGRKVLPHVHALRPPHSLKAALTQECWFVHRGSVLVQLFDEERVLIHEQVLQQGQLLVTFAGGHALECLETDSILLEFKNGPYLGKDYQAFECQLKARTSNNA